MNPILNNITYNNSMTTLTKVKDTVNNLSAKCYDSFIDIKDISFDSIDSVRIRDKSYQMQRIAQQSIAYRLSIPLYYLKRCPTELQRQNLNYWITKERNEALFFRFDDNTVRAIFTPKYKPVDNHEILHKLDTLGYERQTPVQFYIDREFMLLNIPFGQDTFDVRGDRITPGISISNSEVGIASLSISAYLLRLICTNGLISTTDVSESYKHISRKILDEFQEVIERITVDLANNKERLEYSIDTKVEEPTQTIKRFNRQFSLNKIEVDAVDWAWEYEKGDAMYHIVQTYTRASQYEGLTVEMRYKLQKIGGRILGMLN